MNLDGERGWHAQNALGESTVGPLGLLSVMETQLGLTRVEASQAERVVQMRECLTLAGTGSRFYEKSFGLDELGTASVILSWRDQWYEHGWDGVAPADASARILDMSAIDHLAQARVFPGMGQRLNAIADALTLRQPQIECMELLDSLENLPATWRRVLALLSAKRIPATIPTPRAPEGSMLLALQSAVLQMKNGRRADKIPWRDDGSVRIVRAESTLAAAEWLAAHTRSSADADRIFVIEHSGGAVDAALAAMDQPMVGCSESSAARPTLQVLPLALSLLWEPLDFRGLLQFLTHPVGPIPRRARETLAAKIASAPGIGGDKWESAIQEIEKHYGEDGSQVIDDIKFWLESPRFSSIESTPIEFILSRVTRLGEFFKSKMMDPEAGRRASWAAAQIQASAVEQALHSLRSLGEHVIPRKTLDRLLSQATGSGYGNPLLKAEAAAAYRVREPSAVIEPFDEVCWWHMTAVPLVKRYPWSPRELEQLRAMGVNLPLIDTLLDAQASGWLNPIMAARRHLILMLPSPSEEFHPAWLTLSSLLENPAIVDIERVLTAGAASQGLVGVPHRPLPQRRRWWQLPANPLKGWDRAASYSSLDQFFNSPYQWMLNYRAKLNDSALLVLPTDFQLLGTLAHRLVERLYGDTDALTWPVAHVGQWFEQAVVNVVREEGAVLLISGRGAELESFRLHVRSFLLRLHECLRSAGAISIETEKSVERQTPLGSLAGTIDLLVTLRDGRQAIIDLKWAGAGKNRQKLKDQRHTQLAIYARLIENNSSSWPAVAYFIVNPPEFLTTDDSLVPGIAAVSVPGASTSQVWDRIMATWQWRRAQIDRGVLEVVLEGLEPTAESVAPSGALAVEALDPRYNAYLNLAGWEVNA